MQNLPADNEGLTEREMGEACTSCVLSPPARCPFFCKEGRARRPGAGSPAVSRRLSSLTPRCKCFARCVATRRAINLSSSSQKKKKKKNRKTLRGRINLNRDFSRGPPFPGGTAPSTPGSRGRPRSRPRRSLKPASPPAPRRRPPPLLPAAPLMSAAPPPGPPPPQPLRARGYNAPAAAPGKPRPAGSPR